MTRTTRFPPLASFNRDRDFIVTRPFKVSGKELRPGNPFDKTQVNTRRLRQLYDGRFIRMVDDGAQKKVKKRYNGSGENESTEKVVNPVCPEFESLPEEVLIDWLQVHEVIPRVGTSHGKLVERAKKEWYERYAK